MDTPTVAETRSDRGRQRRWRTYTSTPATAPISNDPETSDLDRWCHDVDNPNVVDGVPSRPGNDRKFEGDHGAPVPALGSSFASFPALMNPLQIRDSARSLSELTVTQPDWRPGGWWPCRGALQAAGQRRLQRHHPTAFESRATASATGGPNMTSSLWLAPRITSRSTSVGAWSATRALS